MCYALLVCTEIIAAFLFLDPPYMVIFSNSAAIIPEMITANLLPFVVVLGLERYRSGDYRESILFCHWIALLAIPVGSVYLSMVLVTNNPRPQAVVLAAAVLLVLNVLVFYLLDAISSLQKKKRESEV